MTEFIPWPKTARYFRDVVVTEKIDGTNAAIHIVELTEEDREGQDIGEYLGASAVGSYGGVWFALVAQSRKRLITPESDNFGFARWVRDNAGTLVEDLGPGTHFGEWWGQGIQRGYGLDKKLFSLFNTSKWQGAEFFTPQLRIVPVLYEGPHHSEVVKACLLELSYDGSLAAAAEDVSFKAPEGVCIFHTAANLVFKATILNDEKPKGSTE